MTDIHTLREYQAMDPKDRTPKRAIVMRLASGETVHLKYPDIHLKRVAPDQTAMAIFCYSINVVLRGKRLGEIADAMDGENLPWVQEFDPVNDRLPDDARACVVERIETYAKKGEDGEGPKAADAVRPASAQAKPAHEPETVRRQEANG